MKTTQEKLSVMQAYANGMKIQFQQFKKGEWIDWIYSDEPIWDWRTNYYRVKPEPPKKKIVPYENAEEFITAQKEHGIYVKERDGLIYTPSVIGNVCVVVGASHYSYGILSTDFHFLDGTPCGKEIEV